MGSAPAGVGRGDDRGRARLIRVTARTQEARRRLARPANLAADSRPSLALLGSPIALFVRCDYADLCYSNYRGVCEPRVNVPRSHERRRDWRASR